jgi:hypothetical protein
MISRGGMPFGALIFGMTLERFEAHWSGLAATLLMVNEFVFKEQE